MIKNPSLLTASHINATVGPLTAVATRALQPFARQNHIHIFSLSNDPSLSDDNTVVLGYRVDAEVTRILDYAGTRGKNHILAVIPKDAYGDAIIAALSPQQIQQMQLVQFSNLDELVAGLKTVANAPDAVFIPISGKNLPPVLKALSAAGLTPE